MAVNDVSEGGRQDGNTSAGAGMNSNSQSHRVHLHFLPSRLLGLTSFSSLRAGRMVSALGAALRRESILFGSTGARSCAACAAHLLKVRACIILVHHPQERCPPAATSAPSSRRYRRLRLFPTRSPAWPYPRWARASYIGEWSTLSHRPAHPMYIGERAPHTTTFAKSCSYLGPRGKKSGASGKAGPNVVCRVDRNQHLGPSCIAQNLSRSAA